MPFHEPTYTTPSTTEGDADTAPVPLPVEKNHRTFSRDTVLALISPSCGLKRFRVRSKPYVGQSAGAGHAAGAGESFALNCLPAWNVATPPNSTQYRLAPVRNTTSTGFGFVDRVAVNAPVPITFTRRPGITLSLIHI